jgi:uncharacterized protein (UPF0332 family)
MLNKKSEANLKIATACLQEKDNSYYSVGASRAYYAVFQATKWFLEKNNFDYEQFKNNNHIAKWQKNYAHGTIGIALETFLKYKGFNSNNNDLLFIKKIRTNFRKLYSLRLEGDYEGSVIRKKDLKKAINRAEMFINELKKYNS